MPRSENPSGVAARAGKRPLSRLEAIEDDGGTADVPEVPLPLMVEWWRDLGLVEVGVMGPAVFSWLTLHHWQSVLGIVLTPWQARTLRRMSRAYLAMSEDAKDLDCPSPLGLELTQRKRELVSEKIRAARASANVRRVKRSEIGRDVDARPMGR